MGIKDLIKATGGLINYSLGLMIALALLVFLWGLAKFIIASSKGGKPDEGKSIMGWGLVALFIMVSVWGIIGFFQKSFELPNTATTNNPQSGNNPRLGNDPQPGLLPSRNPFIPSGNAPVPGNLPSTNTYIWPANQPESGNEPQPGNLPYTPF